MRWRPTCCPTVSCKWSSMLRAWCNSCNVSALGAVWWRAAAGACLGPVADPVVDLCAAAGFARLEVSDAEPAASAASMAARIRARVSAGRSARAAEMSSAETAETARASALISTGVFARGSAAPIAERWSFRERALELLRPSWRDLGRT